MSRFINNSVCNVLTWVTLMSAVCWPLAAVAHDTWLQASPEGSQFMSRCKRA